MVQEARRMFHFGKPIYTTKKLTVPYHYFHGILERLSMYRRVYRDLNFVYKQQDTKMVEDLLHQWVEQF